MRKYLLLILLAGIACAQEASNFQKTVSYSDIEINSILMETTYKIEGPSSLGPGATSTGTGFIVGKPNADATALYYVLVTAAHVLDDIVGPAASIHFRTKTSDGKYKRLPLVVPIRESGKDLYTKHPKADVAVMYIKIPNEAKLKGLVTTKWFADDETVKTLEIHPGDELLCLGFPLGFEANAEGFPVLRSGKIASYPITPLKDSPVLFDFHVFGGNSGGPVYFAYLNRIYNDTTHFEVRQSLFGLVSQQAVATSNGRQEMLEIAKIVPAVYIKEAIDKLPANPE